ncbi:amidohydrolase family protein [Streptomyces pristinaespiralis]|uniref:Dihydroorotase n=2 Tax=Streptomyces pristinaespiralis TaxID=38300 RepID=B5H6U2_STRE2|nr:amidohydrolase family protein [Streptomyces pristinaespiralis]ALC18721.1 amidohydrolase [Streptomyces pristinaespiralis]EDY62553.1 dihydroorotase [Streptomyces pristinaespiralis ATCC 25486]QMU18116.1 amidohydrolase family protein [Streptomyces pristinaespiralis]
MTTPEFDLVIRGGRLVDGTGGSSRTADVAVRDGLVVAVGRVGGAGAQEIDADGAVVSPGFVDIHTHYDGQATWDDRLQPSSWHGVTTVVAGNCGVGFAPVRPDHRDRLIALMEGIEDIPETALHAGISWDWQSFPEYLDALENRPRDIDLGTQVPHAALRVNVMADRALAGALATGEDIVAMSRIAREAVEAGALGFSTSRTINHKSLAGDITPSYDAGGDELVAISREIGRTGSGVLQYVTDFDDVEVDMRLIRQMVQASGRPLSVSLVQNPKNDVYREVLAGIERANEDGLPVRAQVAPRAVGLVMGLQCTLHPFMANVHWRKIAHLPVSEQARAMADPEFKRAVLAASDDHGMEQRAGMWAVRRFELMFELGDPPNYEPGREDSLAARAERVGRSPLELAYDVLLQDEGRGLIYVPALNYSSGNLDAVHEMLTHPYTLPGLSDGGAHVGTICDASFPTTLLQHWVRDRDGERLPLEFVISRQARQTAEAVGLHDRGVLAPGYKADINVIDLVNLRLGPPEVRYDLPTGKPRLLQRTHGYLHTVVSGVETYRNGEATGELPGRLVRGAKHGPAAPVS